MWTYRGLLLGDARAVSAKTAARGDGVAKGS